MPSKVELKQKNAAAQAKIAVLENRIKDLELEIESGRRVRNDIIEAKLNYEDMFSDPSLSDVLNLSRTFISNILDNR